MVRHDNAANEWVALGAWDLTPSAISYEHLIKSMNVQGERAWDGARREGDIYGSNVYTDG